MPNNFENFKAKIDETKTALVKDAKLPLNFNAFRNDVIDGAVKAKELTNNHSKSELPTNSLATSLGNVGEATGIGLVNALPSINDLPKDIEKLPLAVFNKKTLTEFGTSAGLGMVMRAVLPETGIIPLAVGGYFMVNFAIDAVKPLVSGWGKAWNAKSNQDIQNAANIISSGTDSFVANSAIGLAGFGLGYKGFEIGGKAILGDETFAKFDNAKNDFWTSNDSFVGKNLNKATDLISGKLKSIGHGLAKSKPEYSNDIANVTQSDLPIEEKLNAIKSMVKHYAHDQQNEAFYMIGAIGKDGVAHGFDRTLDLISQGEDPAQVSGKRIISDTTKIPSNTSSQNPIETINQAQKGDSLFSHHLDKTPKAQFDPQNITDLAGVAKQLMNSWSGEKQVIADVTDPQVGAVSQGLYPAEPLDPGYRPILPQLDDLRHQITDIQDLRVVQPIMDGVSRAVTQRGAYYLDQTSQDVWSLNKFGQQIYEGLKNAMIEKGKLSADDVNEILTMKNPSLFLVRSDGTDPIHGQPGQGPYTVPGIKGVISLDTVYVPRNMSDLTSLMANGIYGHELGHDQYGGILKFPQAIREEVIESSIKKAVGNDEYNKEITVPGVGKLTQGKLIEEIFKAQANENTADMWGAAWTGKNAGFSLGMLLQALRDSGKLESRTVYGQPLANEENPLGIEVHAIDKLRPIMIAQAMRILGKGDTLVNSQADALEAYAKANGKAGDYTWFQIKPKSPEMGSDVNPNYEESNQVNDTPGKPKTPPPSFSINEDLMNKAGRAIVEAQLTTPLSSLKGRTFNDILPDLASQVHRMADLGKIMADDIESGKNPSDFKFNTKDYTMNDVLGAGIDAATLLVSRGMDPLEANTKLNEFSGYIRNLYHTDNPGDPAINWQNPSLTKHAINIIKEHAVGKAFVGMGNFLDVNHADSQLGKSKMFNFLPLTAGASTSIKIDELMHQDSIKKQISGNQ